MRRLEKVNETFKINYNGSCEDCLVEHTSAYLNTEVQQHLDGIWMGDGLVSPCAAGVGVVIDASG